MQGIELSRRFWQEVGYPRFLQTFPARLDDIAVGMIGPGSECFFFDDELSRDHDWGPGFCIWINDASDESFLEACSRWYESLPGEFLGYPARNILDNTAHRVGVESIVSFYHRFTGLSHLPYSEAEWQAISTSSLATCTNGEVFHDPCGEFTLRRSHLLSFYPEKVRQMKIARLCLSAAQSGQYNLLRSLKRRDVYTSRYCLTKFLADAISLIYLLNRRYEPFYKWAHRGLSSLPLLGEESARLSGILVGFRLEHIIEKGIDSPDAKLLTQKIDRFGELIAAELTAQHMGEGSNPYLWLSGHYILDMNRGGN